MGKLTNFGISFSNTGGVCYSGTSLQGYLTIELSGKIKIKAIKLRFHGYASVHWTERHSSGTGKNKRAVTKHYTADELYFDHSVSVFSTKGESESLPVGIHTFPFEFFVPKECPTSYEGANGKIRYYVSARIHKLWAMDNVCLKAFTVVNPFDLNQDTRSKSPAEADNEMMLCCLCCKSGPIMAKLSLEKIGYAPGEIIPINAEIINRSRRKISGVTAALQMVVTYTAMKKVKTHCNVIASITGDGVKSGKTLKWNSDKLSIPPVPPSFVEGCNIIDISYILELIVHPTGPAFNLPVKIEIIIGTVPLHQNFSLPLTPTETFIKTLQFSHFKRKEDIESACSSSSLQSPGRNGGINLDPQSGGHSSNSLGANKAILSFEESALGKVNIDDEDECEKINGKVIFVPMYPYFRTPTSNANFKIQSVPANKKRNIESEKMTSINGR